MTSNKLSQQGRMMPLNEIYRYISQKYPYFKMSNNNWKR